MLKEYVKEELILLNLDISNRNDLFRQLSEIFQERGYINEGFYDFIVEREENYPTGLDLGTHTVAIPHGNPEYIKQSFISVVTLQQPIKMKKMEDAEEEIDVAVIFCFRFKRWHATPSNFETGHRCDSTRNICK